MHETGADGLQLSDALHARLAQCPEGVSVWLALDGVVRLAGYERDEIEQRLDAVAEQPQSLRVVLQNDQIDRHWYPTWVPLDLRLSAGSFLLQDSLAFALSELSADRLQQGLGRRVAGWLEVEGPASQAAAHLGRTMIQRPPGGALQLLRLHDPAVLWAVWPLLSPQQQAQWLGPICRWNLIDPASHLVSLVRPPANGAADAAAPSAEQWSDIHNLTALNGALRAWLPDAGRQSVEALERARACAASALRRARGLGFHDQADLALFAEHALRVHPHFDSHERLRKVLEPREPDDYYSLLVEPLTAEDWSAVSAQVPGSLAET